MQNDTPIRLGIIGAGHMTMKRHLPALARLEARNKCVLQAIADINIDAARSAAEKYHIPYSTHIASNLIERDDIDAVCIFAPADIHYTYGLAVLRASKHLFVEKPPAQNVRQLMEMWALAQARGLIAVAGFNRRFQRALQDITNHVRSESVQSAEAVFHKPNASTPVPFGMRTWLGVSAIHGLDVLCFVMGDRPTALFAASNGGSEKSPENFSVLIQWGERHATFSSNNSAGSRLEQYTFHDYDRSFVCDASGLHMYRGGEKEKEIESQTASTGGIEEEFESFIEAVHSGIQPPHALNRIAPSLYLVELIENGHQGPIDWSFLDDASVLEPARSSISGRDPRLPMVTTDTPAILILNPSVFKKELPLLSGRFTIVYEENLATLSKESRGNIVAVITGGSGGKPFDASHLALAPSVRALMVVGASVKRWGGSLAIEKGLAIINTADVYADAVAEFIVMQAILGLRRASMSHEAMRQGGWNFSAPNFTSDVKSQIRRLAQSPALRGIKGYLKFLRPVISAGVAPKGASTRMLQGRTIGIVGFGEITKKTIPLFVAHGCRVLVYSEHSDPEMLRALGAENASLPEVLRADVVSLQRGLSPRTLGAFGAREINAMRPGSVFINSARAGLVDTEALIQRLRRGDIFACLDVFDEEPPPRHDELRTLTNVFLTAHIAGSAHHINGLIDASNKKLIEKLEAFLEGKPVEVIQGRAQFENMT